MKNRRLVSIDLGSAYTKVAIRRDWNAESDLLRAISIEVVKHARRTGALPPEGDPRDFREADPAQNPPHPS